MNHLKVFVINLGHKNDLKKLKVELMATTRFHTQTNQVRLA